MAFETHNVGPPLTEARIKTFERELGVSLPAAYRAFLLRYNGGRPDPHFFPIRGLENNPFGGVHYFWGLDRDIESSNLDWDYRIHRGRMPSNLIAIAGTDTGDSICLSLRGADKGTVYFWDHNAEHRPPTYDNVYFIASSFEAFLESIHFRDISAEVEAAVRGAKVLSRPS